MTIQAQLKLILQLSNLTQEQLARELGVTFVALNRWVNAKAVPRQRAQLKITELYCALTGEHIVSPTALGAKEKIIEYKRKQWPKVLQSIIGYPDIMQQFLLSLTYNTNRIEGSTLSEDDTAAILFENATLSNKSLVEHLEAKNHQTALNFLFEYIAGTNAISEDFIQKLHGILINSIRPDAGQYRRHAVRIVGAFVPTANYLKISELMNHLVSEIKQKPKDVIAHVTQIHAQFEQIHPFADGNGRVGRLLMQAMLLKQNFPPAVIKQQRRKFYMRYLNQAQIQSDFTALIDFIADAVIEGYKIMERQ